METLKRLTIKRDEINNDRIVFISENEIIAFLDRETNQHTTEIDYTISFCETDEETTNNIRSMVYDMADTIAKYNNFTLFI